MNPVGEAIGAFHETAHSAVAGEPVEHVASRQRQAGSADAGGGQEFAAAELEFLHGHALLPELVSLSVGGSVRYQPVTIERSSLMGPAARIISMWMMKK